MSKTTNLANEEAISKLQELIKGSPTCMLATHLTEIPAHMCPMRVQETDYEGRIWFFSGAESTHNRQINADPRVQLIFTNNSSYEFLTVFGTAEISRDQAKIDRLWNKMVEAWFPEGRHDPNLTLICVHPETAHYWDTRDGKLMSIARVLTAAVTGGKADAGVEGTLDV